MIYEIASGVVRWKLYLDWVLSHLRKEGVKKDVRHLLWMSLYQVFFMKKAVYHVVNETVDYAKKRKGQGMANFVNAVLRRAIRERDALPPPCRRSRLAPVDRVQLPRMACGKMETNGSALRPPAASSRT